jgi:hypothetical protein
MTQRHVYHVFMYLCKVDYMMANTFMYVTILSNYNKVMCIILASYRIATVMGTNCQ